MQPGRSSFRRKADPEVAFLGRSNVGKSSLLNALVGHDGLAFTSSRPGCTQSINFYPGRRSDFDFVDLPGYGFARVPKDIEAEWKELIESYLLERERSEAVASCCWMPGGDGWRRIWN